MRLLRKIYDKVNDKQAPLWGEYLILFILFLIPFVSMMYGDMKAFTHYEVNFWGSIFKGGGLKNFYEYGNEMLAVYRANGIGGAYELIYDFPVYIVFGIWGLPLYLFCNATGIEETSSIGTMLYAKSIYIVALGITAYLIYVICKNIKINQINSKWASYLFLSSAVVFVEIGLVGQLDVLAFPFILLGLYYYQNKEYIKFIIYFSIAVSFKLFPLFIFIPLLLLYEKNIIKIMYKTILALSFTIIAGIWFPQNTMAADVKNDIRNHFFEAFLGNKLPLYNCAVPLVIVLFGVICVYCYVKQIENQEEQYYYSIMIPLVVMFVVLVSFDSNPYWFVYLSPFLAMIMVYNSSKFHLLILFESIGMTGLILNQFGGNYWVYETSWAEGMALEYLFGKPEYLIPLEVFIGYTRLDFFSSSFFAVFIVCVSTVIYLSGPKMCKQSEDVVVRKYALARLLLNIGVAMIPIFVYLLSFPLGNYLMNR